MYAILGKKYFQILPYEHCVFSSAIGFDFEFIFLNYLLKIQGQKFSLKASEPLLRQSLCLLQAVSKASTGGP